ncbi:MAG: hypothetical protein VKL39_13935 [Leptolyngbyaceae bacterium]|nr:hypothetical protein [Leptolyngbyaceae bacterium]
MNNQFHSVDSKVIENVTLQAIQTDNLFPEQTLDYSLPIFVEDKSIPTSSQDTWLTIEFGYDPTVEPNL